MLPLEADLPEYGLEAEVAARATGLALVGVRARCDGREVRLRARRPTGSGMGLAMPRREVGPTGAQPRRGGMDGDWDSP